MHVNGVKQRTNHKWLNLFEIDYTNKTGGAGSWIMASRKNQPRLDGQAHSDAVVIVPWHTEQNKLVLLHEFRLPLNGCQYAFPAGLIDPGETVETTAHRELLEETGLTLTRIRMISPPLVSSAGLSDEAINIVFADCEGLPQNVSNASEEARTILISTEEIAALLKTPEAVFDVRAWLILSFLGLKGFFTI